MTKSASLKKPLVSIVMPVYNCAKYLPEALVSLMIQTFDDFEIVAVNDGSTDNSADILEKFSALEPRLRVITQQNGGIVKALNRGIKEAKGEFIARMDGDDISFPNRLAEQVAILQADSNVVLVAGDFEIIDEASRTLYRDTVVPDNEFIQRAFYLRNAIAHGSVMFRKETVVSLGGYSDKFGPTEDMELWMRLSKEGKFAATGTCVYRWRVNSQGITSTNNPESVRQAKEHLSRRWREGHPAHYDRKTLIKKIRSYLIDHEDGGADYKRLFLTDTAQIGAKYIAQKQYRKGVQQLFAVASTGRQGMRITRDRVKVVAKAQLHR